MDTLQTSYYFSSAVHYIDKPEYLQAVRNVFNAHIEPRKKEVADIYPVIMTGNLIQEPTLKDFCDFTVGTAWNILNAQGYAMDHKETYFHSMWGQSHYKYSNMEEHIHNDGTQIVGFYFLDVPERGSRVVFYDPRTGKKQAGMPEADNSKPTEATDSLVFEPKAGSFYFTNSWLPHSFTRNGSNDPVNFIHFNINVRDVSKPVCNKKGPIII